MTPEWESPSAPSARSDAPRWLPPVLAGLIGAALELVHLPLLGGDLAPPVALGSVPALVVAVRYGWRAALLTQVLALAPSWGPLHLTALTVVPRLLEPIAICVLHRRLGGIVFASAVFWFAAGLPLAALLLATVGGLPWSGTLLVLVAQADQGLLAALLAELAIRVTFLAGSSVRPRLEPLEHFVLSRVAMVSLFLLLVISVAYTRTGLRDAVGTVRQEVAVAAQGVATDAQEFLAVRVQELRRLAQATLLLDARGEPPGRTAELMDRLLARDSVLVNLVRSDAEGRVLLLRPDTLVDGSRIPLDPPPSIADRPYFVAAREARRTVYQSLVEGTLGIRRPPPEPILIVAEPLLDADGRFRGVVLGAVDLIVFNAEVFRGVPARMPAAAGSGAVAFALLNEEGRVLASTGDLLPGAHAPAALLAAVERVDEQHVAAVPTDADTRADPLAAALGRGRSELVHRAMLASGWRWSVVGTYDRARLWGAAVPVVWRSLLMTALALVLLYGVTVLVARQITLPVLAAHGAARQIARGAGAEEIRLGRLQAAPAVELRQLAEELERLALAVQIRQARTEAREEDARARLATIFEEAPVGIFHLDAGGSLTEVNPAFARMLGRKANELVGTPVSTWLEPEALREGGAQPAPDPDPWAELLAGARQRVSFSVTLATADGDERRALVVATRVERAGDGPDYVLGVVQDVTERARLEDRLRQIRRLESISMLAAGVAHDFNNSLTPVLGYAELARAESDPRQKDEFLGRIADAAKHARDLVQQLLALGRKQMLRIERFPVARELEELAEMARRVLRENIRVSLEPPAPTLTVHADPGQLRQVLLNLAVNAQDAMPEGGSLRLAAHLVQVDGEEAARMELEPGTYVEIVVQDDGSGMPPEVAERIFEPFFTTKPRGKGSGLGLATAYGIVRQHGGTIRVDTAPGRGSRFGVLLPADAGVAPDPDEPTPESSAPDPLPDARGVRVLLVEDDPEVRRIVRALLRRDGFSVVEASGVSEGLEACRREARIDVILSDVVLADGDGRALATAARDAQPNAEVLFMSGYAADVLTEEGRLPPGVRVIGKPFTAEALRRAILETLAGR